MERGDRSCKVALTPSAAVLDPGIPLDLAVDAQFLYGAPAVGLHGEADISISRDENPIAGAGGYSFGLIDEKVEGKSQRSRSRPRTSMAMPTSS